MEEYLFIGEVLPQRAQISISVPEINFTPISASNSGVAKIEVINNHAVIAIKYQTEIDIFSLRNIVHNLVRSQLDIVGYLKGYAYEFEVVRVLNSKRNIDYVFGIGIQCIGTRNTKLNIEKHINLLRNSTSGELGVFVGRCLGDLVSALKNADDTAFYCYRAIETLFQHCTVANSLGERSKTERWDYFRKTADCKRDDIIFVKDKADPIRHGNITPISSDEREEIFLKTWDIVDGYLGIN